MKEHADRPEPQAQRRKEDGGESEAETGAGCRKRHAPRRRCRGPQQQRAQGQDAQVPLGDDTPPSIARLRNNS